MSTGLLTTTSVNGTDTEVDPVVAVRGRRDLQRTFQLLLATVWLLDAVLQIQPFMFTKGSNGFSGMLHKMASGNPSVVAHTITWNASVVYHQPILTNTLFALVQFLIGFGIASTRTLRPALVLSIVWALNVWWFGEGAGGVFHGAATPFGGGPGAVLFYALLAVLLWPSDGSNLPFVAARTVGVNAARAIWAGVWGLLAVLAVVGNGRQPNALHDLVAGMSSGQPGWLAHIDKVSESFFLHHGSAAAVLLAVMCLAAALSIYLPPSFAQFMIVMVIVVFAIIWIAVEDLGGILAGGATDPNSGPAIVLLALIYWPLSGASTGVGVQKWAAANGHEG
ncbi:MAG: hypothetical protein JO368_00780 [Acidimicrobiales bacterium]|nr:hypothetical protein [Acidimicrobiales bacterium]